MPLYPYGGGGGGPTLIEQMLEPEAAQYLGSLFPEYRKINGTSIPISGLYFDPGTDEAAFWKIDTQVYNGGDVTVRLLWYADTSVTLGQQVVWGVSLAAITPNTDTQDIETKALAAEVTVIDAHLGTVGQRLHSIDVLVSGASLDALAIADACWARVRRVGSSGSDNLTGDAVLERAIVMFAGP